MEEIEMGYMREVARGIRTLLRSIGSARIDFLRPALAVGYIRDEDFMRAIHLCISEACSDVKSAMEHLEDALGALEEQCGSEVEG